MIIIVTVKKNTLIVSSELTMLHKHDLISPRNGAGIVKSVFQKKDWEVPCSPMPRARPHIEGGREMEPSPRLSVLVPGLSSLSQLTCLVSLLTSLIATKLVLAVQGDQSSQSHQPQILPEE